MIKDVYMTKVVALAGGVGGAKLARGLSRILDPQDFSVIVNTGDDFIHYGLNISPDLDTVLYNLAGINNTETGWGRKDETWNCLRELNLLGDEPWFNLGDRDLALHMERTRLLSQGHSLTEVTRMLGLKLGVKPAIYPMTDDRVSTIIETEEYGEIPFQEYFVKYHFEPKLLNYRFEGIKKARLNHEARRVIETADLIVICPSNPWLSVMPILGVENTTEIIKSKTCVAISPIVGKEAIKGPASKIFTEMGIVPSAMEVAKLYKDTIKGFVLDHQNRDECIQIQGWGIIPLVTDTIMKDDCSKERLAKEVIDFASQISKG